MRVLLTGASGFVGSHLLDGLMARKCEVTLLLRKTSNNRFVAPHRSRARVVLGSLADRGVLRDALTGVTHVLHCAGATKAVRSAGLMAANQQGTRNLIQAVQECRHHVERFLLVSSLAAGRPATAAHPARESDPPDPQSDYGHSKLAAEAEVHESCPVPWTILRPAAVYGPRDAEFLPLFRATARGLAPAFGGGRQALSLVFVEDLAQTALTALTHPNTCGRTLNVATEKTVTTGELARSIGTALGTRPRLVPLPWGLLWCVCVAQTLWSRITGRATILANGKFRELAAPGWVADTTALRDALGKVCSTRLGEGLERTAEWYRREGWVKPSSTGAGPERAA
jgi:nucleoside-diphosphate-sugar epimerase